MTEQWLHGVCLNGAPLPDTSAKEKINKNGVKPNPSPEPVVVKRHET